MPQKVPQPVILAAPTPSENAHEKSFIQALTTINELEKKIQTSTMPIIIKCSATWCPPCKAMKPLYEQLAQELQEKIMFFELDTDQFDDTRKLNIRGIPVFILYRNGKEISRIVGARTYKELKEEVLKAFEITIPVK